MTPVDVEVGKAKKTAVDKEQQEAVDDKETEVDENAGGKVLDVYLDADASGNVADDRLSHTVNSDRLGCKGILKQADGSSSEGSGDGIAARNREENGDNEGKIEDSEARKGSREESLQQDRAERHQHCHGRGEAVLL